MEALAAVANDLNTLGMAGAAAALSPARTRVAVLALVLRWAAAPAVAAADNALYSLVLLLWYTVHAAEAAAEPHGAEEVAAVAAALPALATPLRALPSRLHPDAVFWAHLRLCSATLGAASMARRVEHTGVNGAAPGGSLAVAAAALRAALLAAALPHALRTLHVFAGHASRAVQPPAVAADEARAALEAIQAQGGAVGSVAVARAALEAAASAALTCRGAAALLEAARNSMLTPAVGEAVGVAGLRAIVDACAGLAEWEGGGGSGGGSGGSTCDCGGPPWHRLPLLLLEHAAAAANNLCVAPTVRAALADHAPLTRRLLRLALAALTAACAEGVAGTLPAARAAEQGLRVLLNPCALIPGADLPTAAASVRAGALGALRALVAAFPVRRHPLLHALAAEVVAALASQPAVAEGARGSMRALLEAWTHALHACADNGGGRGVGGGGGWEGLPELLYMRVSRMTAQLLVAADAGAAGGDCGLQEGGEGAGDPAEGWRDGILPLQGALEDAWAAAAEGQQR